MNETMQGVIVGGAIAILTTLVTLSFQYRQWKKERKIEHLKNGRSQFEQMFSVIMKHENFGGEPLTDAYYLCPEKVKRAYDKYRSLGEMSDDDRISHEISIEMEMKKALAELDKQIEKELS